MDRNEETTGIKGQEEQATLPLTAFDKENHNVCSTDMDPDLQASYYQHLYWTSFSFKLQPLVSSLVPLVCWFDPIASTVENSHVESFLLILVVA